METIQINDRDYKYKFSNAVLSAFEKQCGIRLADFETKGNVEHLLIVCFKALQITFTDFQLELKKVEDLARSIGPEFDLVGGKMSALNGFANKLASEGLPLSTEQFAKLKKEMGGEGGNGLSSITREVGEAFSTLAGRIQVQSIYDTDLAVSEK